MPNRGRTIRWWLWTPAVLVLLSSLFHAELAVIVSNGFRRPTVVLRHYRVTLPMTWAPFSGDKSNYLWTLTAPGIARIGPLEYWNNRVPVTHSAFYPIDHPENLLDENVPLSGAVVVEKRSFPFGKERLTCWDLVRFNKFVGPTITEPGIAEIGCSSDSNDFYAHFFGWRGDARDFYATLQRITMTE